MVLFEKASQFGVGWMGGGGISIDEVHQLCSEVPQSCSVLTTTLLSPWPRPALYLCVTVCLQAESLIEAIDIYEEESRKLAEHAAQCKTTGKEVHYPSIFLYLLLLLLFVCVCVCICMCNTCAHACMCVCVCVWGGGGCKPSPSYWAYIC